jgi:biotin carboxyl carrier protein
MDKTLEIEIGNFETHLISESDKNILILEKKGNFFKILYHEKIYDVVVKNSDADHKNFRINVEGYDFSVHVNESIDQLIKKMGFLKAKTNTIKEIKAPMPGLVLEIYVKEGDAVGENQNILSLEAMKMENILKSPGTGIIKEIIVEKGMAVDKNQVLIIFE